MAVGLFATVCGLVLVCRPPWDWTDNVVYVKITNHSVHTLRQARVCFLVGSTPRALFDSLGVGQTLNTRFVHHISSDMYVDFVENGNRVETPTLGYPSADPLWVNVIVSDNSVNTSYEWR